MVHGRSGNIWIISLICFSDSIIKRFPIILDDGLQLTNAYNNLFVTTKYIIEIATIICIIDNDIGTQMAMRQ